MAVYIVRVTFSTTMSIQQLTFVPAARKSIMCRGEILDMTQQKQVIPLPSPVYVWFHQKLNHCHLSVKCLFEDALQLENAMKQN